MLIIGLSGKASCGKDTFASMLEHCFAGKRVTKLAFASFLKQEVAFACNVTTLFIDQHKPNFRKILQGWGTDYRRELHGQDYWTKKLEQALDILDGHSDIVIITDVRFHNEAEMLANKNAFLVRLIRTNIPTTDTHASEIDLDNYTFHQVIFNDKTLEDLLQNANLLTKKFLPYVQLAT